MKQAAALIQSRSYSESYNLPPEIRKRKSKMGTKSPTYTDGKDSEDERDKSEVLMFHGIILRWQLVEMIKNKIFFSEKDGVSTVKHLNKFDGSGV